MSSLKIYKASAGSGKTFTLTTEYIKLLVRNPQNYRQILAVTFTNKATEEMKTRILSQLYGIWKGLEDSKDYATKVHESLNGELSEAEIAERAGQALHLLLHNYSYFRVETIDSFFQNILRNLARELNLTANLRVVLNDTQVEDVAVDKLIDSLSATDQILQWMMRYIMDNISDDRSWNVIGKIKKFGCTIFRDFYKEHSEQLTELMEEKDFFEKYQQDLKKIRHQAAERMKAIGNSFIDTLTAEKLTIDDLSYGKNGVGNLFVKLQNGIFDGSVVTKRATDCLGQTEKWCKKTHPHREQIYHLAATSFNSLLQKAIDEQPRQWKLFKSADLTLRHLSQLRLLSSIEQKVHTLTDEQNCFLLSDTQFLLHELIKNSDSPFIFEKIGTQLEHIMIDEFQDTSTIQWENFKLLLLETMSHRDSENLIVGDVKQSIYRWRGGDWRLLADIKKQFENTWQLNFKNLDTNYRSSRRIVNFNNAFFTAAAQVEDVKAYDDVEQKVPAKKEDNGYVTIRLLPSEDYEDRMFKELSEQVGHLLDSGASASDIVILVRFNKHIPVIANYLMEHLPGLKIVSDEAFRLNASTAVVTIVQALRHLAHPENPIALAYLTEGYCKQTGKPLPEAYNTALLQLPLYELTEQLFNIFHIENTGSEQSAYLCAFFDQVSTFATDYGPDIEAFLQEWDLNIGNTAIQSPETDGIRIISIHKSKGLEFPHVLIPFCDWRLEQPDILWCSPQEAPFNRLPLAPIDYSCSGMKGTIYENDYESEHMQNTVDNLNLLYVAFTRASHSLCVWGKRKSPTNTRSALIEQVLPKITKQLADARLIGETDEEAPIVLEYGNTTLARKQTKTKTKTANPFLQEAEIVRVPINIYDTKTDFKQSNKSIAFAHSDTEDEAQQKSYIQLGSILHQVLSTIRTSDDIDTALQQLELEGILYGEGQLTHEKIADLLRKRLTSPQAREWFMPGRWQLFNECAILTTDPDTGRVVERRPDRVMTDGKQTIVIDFKFGRERSEYHDQVRQYMNLLTDMEFPDVRGYLWLVYTNKIIKIESDQS